MDTAPAVQHHTTTAPLTPAQPVDARVPDHLLHSDPGMDAAMRQIWDLFAAGHGQQHMPAVHTTPVPGAVEAIEPGTGARIWVYLPDPPPVLDTAPAHQGDPDAMPGWAKAVALLIGTGAISTAAVIAVLGTYAGALAALAPLLWALGIALLGLAVLLGVLLIQRHTTTATAPAAKRGGRAEGVETTTTATSTATSRGVTIGRTTATSTTTTTTTRVR
ncbi:hypothetical protein [Streptomyces sp. SM12]|uniref:hypothetical protein n=1 Tax=Streptomyces sp. SM12 TaxID=1071602 RepID=UPI000CD521C1|nr:hypothetical protein [Streptomyces sp. SM12]